VTVYEIDRWDPFTPIEGTISRNRITLSIGALRKEAQKCVLVCSDCHAEVEAGARQLPDTVASATEARPDYTINTP
jgi:hypothetical protein